MHNKKIAIIGAGNLGTSILNGLLDTEGINAGNITVTKRNLKTIAKYADTGIAMTSDNKVAAINSEIIILALKPYNIVPVLKQISGVLEKDKHTIVSLATGVSIEKIEEVVGPNISVFRAMPNTAADVATSITCICSNDSDETNTSYVKQCFDAIGETIFINENLMDSATVLGACGVAYVLRFMRAMVQGGIQIGFDSKTATAIVNQTVMGAAQLLTTRNNHPEHEIDRVTTPKGCTIAGLNEMEHNGFSSALIKGIVTSYEAIG